MGKLEDDARVAAEYARAPRIATVTQLKPPPPTATLTDEILAMLDELAADIRSGKVSPCYLILGFGEDTTRDGQPAEEYCWDSTGLKRRELIGHLVTYTTRLSVDEA